VSAQAAKSFVQIHGANVRHFASLVSSNSSSILPRGASQTKAKGEGQGAKNQWRRAQSEKASAWDLRHEIRRDATQNQKNFVDIPSA
jgi:hypothetical protein